MVDKEITFEDINGALRELSNKVNSSISLAFDAREKMGALVNSSHLRSLLTLAREDTLFRRAMEIRKY